MANEIKVTLNFTLSNGEQNWKVQPGTLRFDQAAIGGHAPIVTINTSAAEDIPTGDVGTLGWMVMQNLSTANYVTWGPKSTDGMHAIGRLEPTEPALFRLEPGTTWQAQADTAACKVQFWIAED